MQTLSLTGAPTGGGFALSFDGQTTANIPFNATAAVVQTALMALGAIGAGNIVCAGGPLPGTAVTITFTGSLAVGPQPLIAVAANTLTGGTTPAPAIANTTPGVATGDVQTLSLTGGPTAGTFTLTFQAQTTAGIPWNATNAQVQAALSDLIAVGTGNVVCTGGPLPGANVVVTFAGQLAPGPQPQITGTATGLIGPGSPGVAVAHTTTGQGVANSVLPVDPDGAVIPNIGWDPAKLSLIDATSGAALTVDTASTVLRYTSGQALPGRDRPGHDRARRLLDHERHRSCASQTVGGAARRRRPARAQPADAARRGAGQRLRRLRWRRARRSTGHSGHRPAVPASRSA